MQDEKSSQPHTPEEVPPGVESRVVAVELHVQSRPRVGDGDRWTAPDDPFPGQFLEDARRYRDLRRQAYPHLETRLIRRYVTHSDEVVED